MRLSRTGPVLGGVVLAAVALAGCGDAEGGEEASGDSIAVVASTNVWGSVAQAVGGDAVSVESLINDPSADPHSRPDTPADATALAGADLVVYNGGGYDEFFTKLLDSTGTDAPQVDAFELSGHGEEEEAEHAGESEEAHAEEGEEGHEHGEVNEHVWYDLPTVKKVADKVAEELGTIAPDDKATFTANAEAFGAELDDLATKAAGIGAANPGAKVVATEPVAHYLLDTAGLADATPAEFSEAIEEETDPPLAVVKQITDLITNRQVAALINNSQTETPVTNSLKDAATEAGVPVVDVTETLPEGVTDYLEWMTSEVDALAGALNQT
jgi:zinc/manganese transport system substrate-binding protein